MQTAKTDPGPMGHRALGASYRLSVLVAALMAVQALAGILAPGLYRDEAFALAAWRVNDPVTLLFALPVLALALWFARRGSERAVLVWLGAMQFSLYNYAFYLFGAEVNVFFPLYVSLFTLSTAALVFGLVGLDVRRLETALAARPARLVAAYLAFWAGILAVAWIGQWAGLVFAGRIPEIGAEAFRLIAALDLSLVVAPVALAAAWVWKRRAWGLVIAVVMLVKGVLYSALLSAASLPLFGTGWGGDPLLPLWLVLLAGGAASLVALLARVPE